MPGFSAMQGLLRRPEKSQKETASDAGNLCGAFGSFCILWKGFGMLPLFPKYWEFLSYLPDSEYFRRWLYFSGRQPENKFYIPWITETAFLVWWKQPEDSYCYRNCSYQRKTEHVNLIILKTEKYNPTNFRSRVIFYTMNVCMMYVKNRWFVFLFDKLRHWTVLSLIRTEFISISM